MEDQNLHEYIYVYIYTLFFYKYEAISRTSEGIRPSKSKTRRMPMGSKRSIRGGGGNGGKTRGKINSEAVKQTSNKNDSMLKYVFFVPLPCTTTPCVFLNSI